MLNQYVAQWKSKFERSGNATPSGQSRRVGHGATAWSLPTDTETLRQPQDGAIDTRSRVAEIRSHMNRAFLNEPEDARITGGTRSLSRRLMGLNVTVPAKAVQQIAALAVPQLARGRALPGRVPSADEAQVA